MSKAGTERVFLGYAKPPLRPAAAWLIERFGGKGEADLGGVFVCVQGRRAAWHLLTMLVEECATRGLVLVPPAIGTPLDLLGEVGATGVREASDARRVLAWCRVLEGADEAVLRALAPARFDEAMGLRSRMHLAEILDATRHELSGQALSIAGAAKILGERDTPDIERWRAAAALEADFERELEKHREIDGAGARLKAVSGTKAQGAGSARNGRKIVLAATPELPRLVRLVLETYPPEAVLLIAEKREAESFDALGTVKPGAFAVTELKGEQIRVAESPAGQAREVERALREVALGTAVDSVLIGVPDAEVVPAIRARLEPAGVKVRDAGGRAVSRSAPAKFLAGVRALLETGHTRELAVLIRHPDVYDWIERHIQSDLKGGAWFEDFDSMLSELPPVRLVSDWTRSGVTHDGACVAIARQVGALLGDLVAGKDVRRGLSNWTGAVRECLQRLYEGVPVGGEGSESEFAFRACEAIAGRLDELGACDGGEGAPAVSGAEAIGLLLSLCESARIPSPAQPDAVEMVGWLEVAFDDAAVCIVTGMNEGSVPRSARGGTLLTGGSRRALEMPGSEAGLSRDAYLLNVLLRCHESVTVIAGRHSVSGDPLTPSRLLFSCTDEELPARVGMWIEEKRDAITGAVGGAADKSGFTIMPRADFAAVTAMPVTSFKAYLASPYGFFLQRVLRLEEIGEPESELGPPAVGDLFHRAMKRFAEGPGRDATAVDDIRASMLEAFEGVLREDFGTSPPGVVRVQAAQLRERIAGVAEVQAKRRAEGWTIAHAEWRPREPVKFTCEGGHVVLTGSIDRIDSRSEGREIAILDYKTSETAQDPGKTHVRAQEWADLQLPLYRHLAAELWRGNAEQPAISLGYINVPRKPGQSGVAIAEWDAATLASADEAARAVAARVLRGEFFELGDSPPDAGALGFLCGEGLLRAEDRSEDNGEGEP